MTGSYWGCALIVEWTPLSHTVLAFLIFFSCSGLDRQQKYPSTFACSQILSEPSGVIGTPI